MFLISGGIILSSRSSDEFQILNVCTVNVNSLSNKLSFVADLMRQHNISVLSVTETWLTHSCASSFVGLEGYVFYRGDCFGEVRKHGTGIYVKNSIRVVQIDVSVPNVAVIHILSYDLYVISVYRPPSYDADQNLRLISFLNSFCVNKEVLLLGDFNLPSIRWDIEDGDNMMYNTPVGRQFKDCFNVCGLTQYVKFATYFPSGNILDLMFTSDPDRMVEVCSLPPLPNCYHCPVVGRLVFQFRVGYEHSDELYAWSKGDYPAMLAELAGVDWELLFWNLDANACYEIFIDIIWELVRRFIPKRAKLD